MPNDKKTKNGKPADFAFINPEVLRWALDKSTEDRAAIAAKLSVPSAQLAAWEQGSGTPPSFTKATRLAKLLHIPFGFLFLRRPPKDTLPLPDMRSQKMITPSPELLALIDDVLVKQDWYRDYLRESGQATKLKFVGSFNARNKATKATDVANSVRNTLDIVTIRDAVHSHSEYLSSLVRQAEAAGILVMRSGIVGNTTTRRVSPKEAQGFAIADPVVPIVYVNSSDYKTAQVFTLAHELAHIWIGQSAISDPNPLDRHRNGVESFCNAVAASVLAPVGEFVAAWNALPDDDKRIVALSRRFWVSTLVVIRRARDFSLISEQQFHALTKDAIAKATAKGRKPSGGDFYRSLVVRMSPRLTYAVLREVNRDALLVRDGARLLSVSVPTLQKFAEMSK